MPTLSAVIVARNEADIIEGCLQLLDFVDETVVIIDDRSTDDTAKLAKTAGAKVYEYTFKDFADLKNFGISKATGEWILVVDADERIPAKLGQEIIKTVKTTTQIAFYLRRDSYFFGRKMTAGGWQEEKILRLFKAGVAEFQGDIHEDLVFHQDDPGIGLLNYSFAHFSHRSIKHNVAKTNNYADVQAGEMLAAGYPKIRKRTLFRVIFNEFWLRMIKKQAWRDGMPGIIEGLYQPFSLFVVYVRLWELQQKPTLEERYKELEKQLHGN